MFKRDLSCRVFNARAGTAIHIFTKHFTDPRKWDSNLLLIGMVARSGWQKLKTVLSNETSTSAVPCACAVPFNCHGSNTVELDFLHDFIKQPGGNTFTSIDSAAMASPASSGLPPWRSPNEGKNTERSSRQKNLRHLRQPAFKANAGLG